MRNLVVLVLGLMLLMMAGCNSRNSHKLTVDRGKAINEANENNKVIANSLKPNAPGHAAVLDAQASKISGAMTGAPESMNAVATFTIAELKQKMAAVIESERAKADEWKKKFEAEKTGLFGTILSWGGWGVVGGLGVFLARALNIPGAALLSDPLVRAVAGNKLKEVEAQADLWTQKAGIAHTAIESSELGSVGLKYLDARLKQSGIDLQPHVESLSNGNAATIQDLFKYMAQSHAVDKGEHVAVVEVLKEIRDKADTHGGEHVKAAELLNVAPVVADVAKAATPTQ